MWWMVEKNNDNAQYSELHRSFTPNQHKSPDRTINCNVWLSPKWSIEGPSRKSATTVDAQEICNVRIRPHTPDQHRSPDLTHSSRSSKKTTNRDVWLSPNWSNTGTSRKASTNHDEQWKGECQRSSCSQEWHWSQEGTYGKHSGKIQ